MKFLFALFIGYIALIGLLYAFQRQMMYPAPRTVSTPFAGVEVVKVTTADSAWVRGWFLPPPAPEKPVIVFFQGNAAIHDYRVDWSKELVEQGYGVFLAGYRGYDGVEGQPTEQGLYADARAQINELVKAGYSLIFFGESLGTGIAVQMATEYPSQAVILEAPYDSMVNVAATHYPFVPVRWLLKDRYDSLSKINRINAPLLILHGTKDNVVPLASAQRLFAAAKEPKEAHWLEGAGHTTLYNYGAGEIVKRFLEQLPHS